MFNEGRLLDISPNNEAAFTTANTATPCALRYARHADLGAPSRYRTLIATGSGWRANLSPERNHVHVQRVTQLGRNFRLQTIHIARRAVLVFLRRPDPALPSGNTPATEALAKGMKVKSAEFVKQGRRFITRLEAFHPDDQAGRTHACQFSFQPLVFRACSLSIR